MSGISETLKHFLTGYLEWVEAGADEGSVRFNRTHGLCVQPCIAIDDYWELCRLLDEDFGDSLHPFQEGDDRERGEAYWASVERADHHLNERRLAWVRSKLGEHSA